MKKLTVVLSAVLCASLMTGCGLVNGNAGKPRYSYYPTEEQLTQAAEVMSEDPCSGDIWIEGTVITMPFQVKDFQAMGFNFDEKTLKRIDPFPANAEFLGGELTRITGEEQDLKQVIPVNLLSTLDREIPLGDVHTTSASFDRYDKMTLIMPKGISWGSTIEEVKAAYGEPVGGEDVYENEYYTRVSLSYSNDESRTSIRISFEAEPDEEFKMTAISFNYSTTADN